MSTALYRKWRSQTFDEVVGQEHVTRTLQNALRDDRVAHAYLFSGPRGTGKTSTARILAKALNCGAPEGERPCNRCATCRAIAEGRMIDLVEIDAASNNSVDDVREQRAFLRGDHAAADDDDLFHQVIGGRFFLCRRLRRLLGMSGGGGHQ
ncbi:MAG: AAA family ATPase, partial [Caldilinea sp.]|nr:AAA family ATPase [Caldilinea sp.]